jgi:hypothetical protein
VFSRWGVGCALDVVLGGVKMPGSTLNPNPLHGNRLRSDPTESVLVEGLVGLGWARLLHLL